MNEKKEWDSGEDAQSRLHHTKSEPRFSFSLKTSRSILMRWMIYDLNFGFKSPRIINFAMVAPAFDYQDRDTYDKMRMSQHRRHRMGIPHVAVEGKEYMVDKLVSSEIWQDMSRMAQSTARLAGE
jgi:hypothetical protein